jgi:hypothetical protein
LDADHLKNATTAEAAGLLEGLAPSGTSLAGLDPYAPMPRGEVAQAPYNLMKKMKESTPPDEAQSFTLTYTASSGGSVTGGDPAEHIRT